MTRATSPRTCRRRSWDSCRSGSNYDRLYQEALSDPELKRTQVELEAALSNSREARRVVFDLFQDLEGSVSTTTNRSPMCHRAWIVWQFLSAAVADRQQKLLKGHPMTNRRSMTVDDARRASFHAQSRHGH